jgi:hypothetical protein
MNSMMPRPRPHDDRALPVARTKFLQLSAMMLASWIVFGLMVYGLWIVFVWLTNMVPVWMN